MAAVVIVGGGVTGLVTAVECALAGHLVTVLDGGAIPNPASSSHDQHRAIHALTPGDVPASRRMAAAQRRWRELEAVLATRFYRRVGIVSAVAEDHVDAAVATAAAAGLPVTTTDPAELPHVTFPAGAVGVVETDAGVLLAERVLRAAAEWLAGRENVRLRPGRTVTSVDSGRVRAGGEVFGADLVLVAGGPWTRDLVGPAVTLLRQTMVYLRPPEHLRHWWEAAPGVGRIGPDGRAWLVPPGAGTLLKISTDAVCREVSTVDSDDGTDWAQRVLDARILSDVDGYTVVAVKDCHYATTEGGAVLTEALPGVWARPACGGNGFASAPLAAGRIVDATMEVAA
ncbi:FAD-dependent oxidoreductase [Actinosynnema sp. CS-041913]|uniref:FAD-dependent oxidoreductase n=1 Tax=Actinosynnema sp. CS-041913 TaxID=3239917 RepID=UPI003D9413CB